MNCTFFLICFSHGSVLRAILWHASTVESEHSGGWPEVDHFVFPSSVSSACNEKRFDYPTNLNSPLTSWVQHCTHQYFKCIGIVSILTRPDRNGSHHATGDLSSSATYYTAERLLRRFNINILFLWCNMLKAQVAVTR